jgi:hypothetical protein
MPETNISIKEKRLRTPRAAAVAGILFSVLLITINILIRLSVPENIADSGEWLTTNYKKVIFALSLVPFAGMFFMYFVGVMRDRLGEKEDQFFSTVFLSSGILYLAMLFVASALVAGILATISDKSASLINSGIYLYARSVSYNLINLYAIRMASIFMMSLATIWLRTGVVSRSMTILTYALAALLLVSISFSLWVTLIFPAWIFIISLYILFLNKRMKPADQVND